MLPICASFLSAFHLFNRKLPRINFLSKASIKSVETHLLTGRLNGPNTVAVLDLGGASTQVTFASKDKHETPMLSSDHIHNISTAEGKINVFSASYLNLGLHTMRYAIFTAEHDNGKGEYISSCINPAIKSLIFGYGANEHRVR